MSKISLPAKKQLSVLYSCPSRLPEGFTLIELLVVISIISLLISILLPALASARMAAKNALCLSQTRTLGQTLAMYMTDEKQYFPYGAEDGNPSAGTRHYFDNTLGRYMNVKASSGGDLTKLEWYDTRASNAWHCPELLNVVANDNSWGLYGPNTNLMGRLGPSGQYVISRMNPFGATSGNRNLQEADVTTAPSGTVTFMEAVRPGSYWSAFNFNEVMLLTGNQQHWFNPHFNPKPMNTDATGMQAPLSQSSGSMNPVFLDGHSASRKPEDFPAYGYGGPRPESYVIK